MVKAKQKGYTGEKEVERLLSGWVEPVYRSCGLEPPLIERNMRQSAGGGYDLVGLDWLALEVKRHERTNPYMIGQWWEQTCRNCRAGQTPLLLYRPNRTPWTGVVSLRSYHGGEAGAEAVLVPLKAILAIEEVKMFVQSEAYWRIKHGRA